MNHKSCQLINSNENDSNNGSNAYDFFSYQTKLALFPTKLLTLCLGLLISCNNHATTYEEFAKIESVCQKSSGQCLFSLENALADSTSRSRQWYRLKLLQLDALFILQQFKKLSEEIDALLTYDELPINFSVYVYIYHAKLNYGKGQISTAKKYLSKAVNLLTSINDKYPKPMRLIEIANLQISMKDFEQAKSTLLQLELKFQDRYHPLFKRELYANLGHVALFQGDEALHVKYRERSLKWALKANNNQQVGIAYHNLAWAFQKAENYKYAEQHYSQAIKFSRIEQDDINGSISQLRLIEVILLQGKVDKALKFFNQLPTRPADNGYSKQYNKLYLKIKLRLKKK